MAPSERGLLGNECAEKRRRELVEASDTDLHEVCREAAQVVSVPAKRRGPKTTLGDQML